MSDVWCGRGRWSCATNFTSRMREIKSCLFAANYSTCKSGIKRLHEIEWFHGGGGVGTLGHTDCKDAESI